MAAGEDVNTKDADSWTPLHQAAVNGHNEATELLITAGADVNAKLTGSNFKGDTPLDVAIWASKIETADLLRKHGGKKGEELKAEGK